MQLITDPKKALKKAKLWGRTFVSTVLNSRRAVETRHCLLNPEKTKSFQNFPLMQLWWSPYWLLLHRKKWNSRPHTWADNFPIARGPRQSPIDIDSNTCVNDPALVQNPIVINYDPSHIETLENTGHGFKISTRPDTYSVIEGGPLENKYRLEQFHFHWGKTLTTGSEHTVDGRSYAAEVHLVHWNYEKYESMAKAAENGDGLCVLGTFLTVGNHHPEIQKLIDRFDEISFKNQKITLDGGFDCLTLLPENRSFWTYPGSLTTPPLFECVIWVVFKENIELSAEQLEAFRQLCSYCDGEECPADEFDGKIVANFRPPLDRGERVVREC